MFRTTPWRASAALALSLSLVGCSNMTALSAKTPGTTLALNGIANVELPRSETLGSKATGQYVFVATGPDGKTFYGLLPLKVNGQNMAASIVLFAPALAIGGFRDAFPFYEVDVDGQVVNYKSKEGDPWGTYRPKPDEVARAKAYFDRNPPKAPASTTAPVASGS